MTGTMGPRGMALAPASVQVLGGGGCQVILEEPIPQKDHPVIPIDGSEGYSFPKELPGSLALLALGFFPCKSAPWLLCPQDKAA